MNNNHILRRKLTQATELVNTVALMIGIPFMA
jgi:hypothetical protein